MGRRMGGGGREKVEEGVGGGGESWEGNVEEAGRASGEKW